MINVRIQHKEVQKLSPRITVVGVGGAGGNAVNNMLASGLEGCEFVVCNTDAQALESSLCENQVQLGVTVTGGLGAGARPEVGTNAAQESLDDVMRYLEGSNMAFITAGMGGGTGTGAAPIIARACREKGILTVGVVTKPFHFEGSRRMKMAEKGIEDMQQYVDTLIVIPNQNLFRVANEKTTFAESFRMADSVLQSAVRGVTDLIVMPGEVNLDFSDIRTVMQEMGKAVIGVGEAGGDGRAVQAAEKAINNPLLDDVSMKGARAVIINICGGSDLTLFEIDEACNRIREEVDPDANIIFGSTFDATMQGTIRVSIIATGIDAVEQKMAKGGKAAAFGPHIINALTAQQQAGVVSERRFDRTQPYTADMQPAATAPATWHTQQQALHEPQGVAAARAAATMAPPLRAPAPAVAAGAYGATARRMEEMPQPEADLFQQPEYQQYGTGIPGKKPEAASAPAPVAATPRASVYNDSFIPPYPVEVQAADREPNATGYGPHFPSLAATRAPQPEHMAPSTAGYILRPPVPGAHAQQKKKSPSIFERFTNPLRHHASAEDAEGESRAESGMRVSQRPLQGTLNIDPPGGTRVADVQDDELDIPAFLRRQAN